MRVSLDILFRVSLFNRLVIEKPLLQITNMEHIFSASLLSGGNCAVALLVARLVTLQLFQNCFPRISRVSSRVWCCNASKYKLFRNGYYLQTHKTLVCHC